MTNMDDEGLHNSLAAELDALAKSKERPETARLREVFDKVEAALAAGVSQAKVLELLQEDGFKMGLASFRTALYRIRKEQRCEKRSVKTSIPQSEECVLLEPYRDDILTLKAKGYPDWQVVEWLDTQGLNVSCEAVELFVKEDCVGKRGHRRLH